MSKCHYRTWLRSSNKPYEPEYSEDEARSKLSRCADTAVLVGDPETPRAVIHLPTGRAIITVIHYDELRRRTAVYEWVSNLDLSVPIDLPTGVTYMQYGTVLDYAEDTDTRPTHTTSGTFGPSGTWTGHVKGEPQPAFYRATIGRDNLHTQPDLEFGDWDRWLRTDWKLTWFEQAEHCWDTSQDALDRKLGVDRIYDPPPGYRVVP